jgi:GINS complex protein helical bundle domain
MSSPPLSSPLPVCPTFLLSHLMVPHHFCHLSSAICHLPSVIYRLLLVSLFSASDDLEGVAQLRTLIADIQDVRAYKVRTGLSTIQSGTMYIKLNNLSDMEINSMRPFVLAAMDKFRMLHNVETKLASEASDMSISRDSQIMQDLSGFGGANNDASLNDTMDAFGLNDSQLLDDSKLSDSVIDVPNTPVRTPTTSAAPSRLNSQQNSVARALHLDEADSTLPSLIGNTGMVPATPERSIASVRQPQRKIRRFNQQ